MSHRPDDSPGHPPMHEGSDAFPAPPPSGPPAGEAPGPPSHPEAAGAPMPPSAPAAAVSPVPPRPPTAPLPASRRLPASTRGFDLLVVINRVLDTLDVVGDRIAEVARIGPPRR